MKVLLLLFLTISLHAETGAQRIWKWSAAALVAGSTIDIASSYGQQELNPLYAGPDGRFGTRGVIVRSAVVATSLFIGWRVLQKHPNAKIPALANFALGGGAGMVAIRNYRVK
jgi:hypothetical protein